MFDLSPAAWVIILTALATYIALLSSWLLAIPARRAALLQGNITVIEADLSQDKLMRDVQEEVIRRLKGRIALAAGTDRRLICRGVVLLVVSFGIFTAAVVLQARTDEVFREKPAKVTLVPK